MWKYFPDTHDDFPVTIYIERITTGPRMANSSYGVKSSFRINLLHLIVIGELSSFPLWSRSSQFLWNTYYFRKEGSLRWQERKARNSVTTHAHWPVALTFGASCLTITFCFHFKKVNWHKRCFWFGFMCVCMCVFVILIKALLKSELEVRRTNSKKAMNYLIIIKALWGHLYEYECGPFQFV